MMKHDTDPRSGRVDILGVPVSATTMADAAAQILAWTEEPRARYVCVADVHSIMKAQEDESHMEALHGASMITPDGTPLSWIGRRIGVAIERVCGPDLMLEICRCTAGTGVRHYFHGGADGVPEQLAEALGRRFPGLKVAGAFSPPFRALRPEEDQAAIEAINMSGANILWVGLGCPKQERWMADHVDRLRPMVVIGVGAAFDFHSGNVRRAPRWMRENGLEWLHRLASEPTRLWRRYVLIAPQFVVKAARQIAYQRWRERISS